MDRRVTQLLSQIADTVGGRLIGTDRPVEVTAAVDSRHVPAGGLFAALPGARVDGHQFVAAALSGGAGGALISDPRAAVGVDGVIVVDDVARALGVLARAHVTGQRDHLKVVAITGSMGKTTTKDLLTHLVPAPVVATRRSMNNELGVPLTALEVDEHTATLVLEMGADHEGDLTYLTGLVPPDVAVVLAVGRAHLGVFGSVAAIARAKAELVQALGPDGTAVLNADDPLVAEMAPLAPRRVFFGRGQEVRAEGIALDGRSRASFTLYLPDGAASVKLGLVGAHHVGNALAAAAAAHVLGVGVDAIAAGLSEHGPDSPHRMDVTQRADGITVIDDAYNANPASMAAALRTLAHLSRGRRSVAVLGPMLELGPQEVELHREVGQLARELGIDAVYTLGELSAHIAVPGLDVTQCADLSELRAALELRAGDVVLFKASNGSHLYELAEEWSR